MTARVYGDLPISRDELIERSTDLFVLVAEHVVGRGSVKPAQSWPAAIHAPTATNGRATK